MSPRPLAAPEGPTFHRGPRAQLRRAGRSHPLGYIARVLPERVSQLVPDLNLSSTARVLDFGCAEKPYRHLFDAEADYVAADLPGNPDADAEIGRDGRVALDDQIFDAVLSTQVLEHVTNPRVYLEECFRVLRPGGRLLLSTHGIMVYHPDPADLWRWTCEGLQAEVERQGFRVLRFEGIMGLAATGLQLTQDSFYHRVPVRLRGVLARCFQTLIAFVDRFEPGESLRTNALVFALVAERPK